MGLFLLKKEFIVRYKGLISYLENVRFEKKMIICYFVSKDYIGSI